MSIVDKLPKPPEGYEWASSVFASGTDTRIYLHLEASYIPGVPPRVPESYLATYEFCDPDENSMILSAGRILEKFEESATEQDRINARQAEESEKYSDLIITAGAN